MRGLRRNGKPLLCQPGRRKRLRSVEDDGCGALIVVEWLGHRARLLKQRCVGLGCIAAAGAEDSAFKRHFSCTGRSSGCFAPAGALKPPTFLAEEGVIAPLSCSPPQRATPHPGQCVESREMILEYKKTEHDAPLLVNCYLSPLSTPRMPFLAASSIFFSAVFSGP